MVVFQGATARLQNRQCLEWSPFPDRPTDEDVVARHNLPDNPGPPCKRVEGRGDRQSRPVGVFTTSISALSPWVAMRVALSYVETYPKRLGARTRPRADWR
jgi:hypothetical protein